MTRPSNVRCAGDGHAPWNRTKPTDPCGWKGQRAKTWDAPTGYERAATAKPCPWCGGRVELIPRVEVERVRVELGITDGQEGGR